MSVTITAVGTTCVVSIVDNNFLTLQDLCRSGIITADMTGTFDRYQVLRYTSGRIVSMEQFASPFLIADRANIDGIFDLSFRHVPGVSDANAPEEKTRSNYAMELLGRPGPSFQQQFQEDGINTATVPGWPPAWWPIDRYPKELCFSKWLTVPHAGKHLYVEEPCVVYVKASCKASLNAFRILARGQTTTIGTYNPDYFNWRNAHLGRFGLIVDTNPKLYDEFANVNPNIVDPVTGAMAPYVSWKIIRDRTFFLPQRANISLRASIALAGRRAYNFRLAYRDAAHHGYADLSLGNYYSGNWESADPAVIFHEPIFNASWVTDLGTYLPGPTTRQSEPKYAFYPSWINLWESASLTLAFKYDRETAYSKNSTDPDFVP